MKKGEMENDYSLFDFYAFVDISILCFIKS